MNKRHNSKWEMFAHFVDKFYFGLMSFLSNVHRLYFNGVMQNCTRLYIQLDVRMQDKKD